VRIFRQEFLRRVWSISSRCSFDHANGVATPCGDVRRRARYRRRKTAARFAIVPGTTPIRRPVPRTIAHQGSPRTVLHQQARFPICLDLVPTSYNRVDDQLAIFNVGIILVMPPAGRNPGKASRRVSCVSCEHVIFRALRRIVERESRGGVQPPPTQPSASTRPARSRFDPLYSSLGVPRDVTLTCHSVLIPARLRNGRTAAYQIQLLRNCRDRFESLPPPGCHGP